ncbi:MAG TPA: 50S ribosomal protein L4 [Candidatus Saccharimonadales bacterium]|nr:50S ribosomal protein L4 [Candidatus Saccharimonadales bacterium]
MANAVSYSASGTKSSTRTPLDKAVFGLDVADHTLLKYAYGAFLDNGRVNLAKTKTRGEVKGSTKKPWRQKGTGRARFGSRYNPIWRGGGIIFGPRGVENYSKKTNRKANRLAVKQALSLAAGESRIKIIDKFDSKDGKTAKAVKLLNKLDVQGKVLIITDETDEKTARSVNNLPNVKLVNARYLNVYGLLNADTIVITKDSLELISEWLASKTKRTAVKTEAGK